MFLWFILGRVKFEFLGSSDSLTLDRNKLQPFVKGTTGPLPAVYLVLHNQPVPIMDLLRCQLIDQYCGHGGYSWPMLLGRLAKGELIYPWVKSRSFRDQLKKQFSAAQWWFYQWECLRSCWLAKCHWPELRKNVVTNFAAWPPATVLPLFELLEPLATQISTDFTTVLLKKGYLRELSYIIIIARYCFTCL